MNKFFGTDGIRGAYGSALMNECFAHRVGRATGEFLKEKAGPHIVALGYDTRPSSPSIKGAIAQGLQISGIKLLDFGVVPSPALAFGTIRYGANLGIMITASHNPFTDNGIKFFSPDGTKLSLGEESLLESLIDKQPQLQVAQPGNNHESINLVDSYASEIAKMFADLRLNKFRIAIDLANGATLKTTPSILQSLGATIIPRGCGQGLINDQCGSEFLSPLQSMVQTTGADLGIAHDGDGDRVRFIDSEGTVVDGDQILGLLAIHHQQAGSLNNSILVSTVHSNSGLEHSLLGKNIKLCRSDVGDRNVFLKMKEHSANFGGESSGHIIATDYLPTGDGAIAALLVLNAMVKRKATLRELADEIKLYPAKSTALRVEQKIPLQDVPAIFSELERTTFEERDNGRVLLRYSGTEPKIRLLVDGRDEEWVNSTFSRFQKLIQKSL